MTYFIADLIRSSQGLIPAFSEQAVCYSAIAEPCSNAAWGLFSASLKIHPKEVESDQCTMVPFEVFRAIESGRSYPPSLAIARELGWMVAAPECRSNPEEMFSLCIGNHCKNTFLQRHKKLIEAVLEIQPSLPFILAEAVLKRPFLDEGFFYWITSINEEKGYAKWISDDYYIYTEKISAFKISEEARSLLSGSKIPWKSQILKKAQIQLPLEP